MRVRRLIPLMAPLGAVGVAVIAGQSVASAYPAPPASGTVVSGCSTLAQGASCTYTFQFVDSTGNPIDGLLASIGLDAVSGCAVTPSSATTSGGGNVSATLTCAGNSGTGSEAVIAQSGSVSVTAAVQIVAANANQGGGGTLPFTGTNPPGPNLVLIAGATAAAVILAGGGAYLIRSRRAAV